MRINADAQTEPEPEAQILAVHARNLLGMFFFPDAPEYVHAEPEPEAWDDAELFIAAMETSDIRGFIDLLNSDHPIPALNCKVHVWAPNPRTIGALATFHLGYLAYNHVDVKTGIGKVGAIPHLLDVLRKKDWICQQHAMIALNALINENPDNVRFAADAGAIQLLMQRRNSPLAHERWCIAATLRDIIIEGDEHRDEFVMRGGIGFFLKQTMRAADITDNSHYQFEAVANLLDLLEDHDGKAIPEYVSQVKRSGIQTKLFEMLKTRHADVKYCIKALLLVLEGSI